MLTFFATVFLMVCHFKLQKFLVEILSRHKLGHNNLTTMKFLQQNDGTILAI